MRKTRGTFKASDRLRFQVNQAASVLEKKDNSKTGAHTILQPSIHGLEGSPGVALAHAN